MPAATHLRPVPKTLFTTALALTAALLPATAHAGPAPATGVDLADASSAYRRVVSSTISTSVLYAGDGATQTVVLDRPAPAGGQFVDLRGSNVGYRESTLYGLRIPQGRSRWTFPVRFTSSSDRAITHRDLVAGTDCSSVNSGRVTVRPLDPEVLAVQSVTFLPEVVPAITTTTVRLRLTAPARSTGTTLALYGGSSGTDRFIAHDLIATVPAGARYVDLPVHTLANQRRVPGTDLIQAYLSSTSASGYVDVLPSDLYVSAPFEVARTTSRQRISLGRPAPAGGAVVRLTDTRSDITYPANVTVPAGQYTTTFPVRTPNPAGTGTVTATWNGQTTTSTITFG